MNKSTFEEYEAIVQSLPDMVFVITESGRYVAILGGENSELYHDGSFLKGLSLMDLLPHQKAIWFVDKIKETLSTNKMVVCEYFLSSSEVNHIEPSSGPTGILRFEGRVRPLKSLRYGERAVVWVARNISERYQLEQQLSYQAQIDPLSKTYNRRMLFERLDDAFYNFQRYQENVSFLMIDIDSFKKINDQLGHQAGDSVIRNIAKLCQLEIRKTDVLGRLGGDEFGIIYKNTIEHSLAFGKRLNMLANSIPCEIGVSISIGLSQFENNDTNCREIYKRADIALYRSKQAGKNECTPF
ncbi:diguanylate cyclase [Vibrio cyclitrophicus]